jgi:hypothetical protein
LPAFAWSLRLPLFDTLATPHVHRAHVAIWARKSAPAHPASDGGLAHAQQYRNVGNGEPLASQRMRVWLDHNGDVIKDAPRIGTVTRVAAIPLPARLDRLIDLRLASLFVGNSFVANK